MIKLIFKYDIYIDINMIVSQYINIKNTNSSKPEYIQIY